MEAFFSSRKTFALYVRNFVFGVEDSLVSTVGLISGIAAAGVPRLTVVLTGVVLVFVEAFSMGVGSFLSERSAEEYITHKEAVSRPSIMAAFIMFISYLVAGFLPLLPYVFITVHYAFPLSIVFSLVFLFLLGVLSAKAFRINIIRNGMEMLVMGGLQLRWECLWGR